MTGFRTDFTSTVWNFCRWVADVLPCETSPAARTKEERLISQTTSIASVWFLKKKMGCQIKTNKSAVLVAKLLTWQIGMISQFYKNRLFFLIERIVWAHCILFNLLYHSLFRNVYRFFSFYTEFYKHIQFKKKKNGESGYRSQFLPHAKRALYHLS